MAYATVDLARVHITSAIPRSIDSVLHLEDDWKRQGRHQDNECCGKGKSKEQVADVLPARILRTPCFLRTTWACVSCISAPTVCDSRSCPSARASTHVVQYPRNLLLLLLLLSAPQRKRCPRHPGCRNRTAVVEPACRLWPFFVREYDTRALCVTRRGPSRLQQHYTPPRGSLRCSSPFSGPSPPQQ
ncbi:hypothetical protein PENSPDRAFT_288229 [Peniophora sp. CONT]|nr:hypothetical protein PENSPDRAFT_288229 [Peniophora sp. CONT]